MSYFLQSAKTSSRDRRCTAHCAGKRRKSRNGHWLPSQIGISKFIRINVCTLHSRCTAQNTDGPQGQSGIGIRYKYVRTLSNKCRCAWSKSTLKGRDVEFDIYIAHRLIANLYFLWLSHWQTAATNNITHIIMDEIHERDKNADFLLIELRRMIVSGHLQLGFRDETNFKSKL